MSRMLQQAVIDAEQLREAAKREAQEAILEKYSHEIKNKTNLLLEQEDELDLDLGDETADVGGLGDLDDQPAEMDPLAANLPNAATQGERACPCPDSGEEIEIDFDELAQAADAEGAMGLDMGMDPLADLGNGDDANGMGPPEDPMALGEQDPAGQGLGGEENVTIPANLAVRMLDYHMSQGDPVYQVGSSAVARKPVPKSLVTQAFDNLESYLDKVNPEEQADLQDILDQLHQFVPEVGNDDDGVEMGLESLTNGMDISLNEELIESILETLEVDQEVVPMGHGLNPDTPSEEHAVDVAIAHSHDETESAEREKLLKSLESLKEANSKLQKQNKTLVTENSKLEGIVKEAGSKLKNLSVTNAKLHYTNRVLESTSLNERQKKVLVESLRKVGSVEEAKAIFETRTTTNGRELLTEEKKPETLSEHVNKGNPLMIKEAKTEKKPENPKFARMGQLAGIRK